MGKEYEQEILISKKYIAKSWGVSPTAVGQWPVKPVQKKGRQVLYYLPEVIAYKEKEKQKSSAREMGDLTQERTRKEKEQADKLEMENELTRGNQVLLSDVEDALTEFVTLSKNKLLGVRARINKVIVARAGVRLSITNQKKIEKGVDEEIRKALDELAGLNTENIQSRAR